MVHEDPLEVLTQLNLSKNQAKIYLTLINTSPLNAVEISKAAALPKEVIYRQMPRLLEKGLVEKIVAIPSKFQATPLKNALENLLQQRSRQNSEIKKSVNRIIQKFSANNKEKTNGQEQKMVLIPKGKRLEEFGKEKLLSTNATLDTCIMGKRMTSWISNQLEEFKQVASRKVKIRAVMEESGYSQTIPSLLEKLELEEDFEIRLLPKPACPCLSIYDNKEAVISIEETTAYLGSVCLWTNYPCFIEMAKSHFEKQWNKAKKIEITKPIIAK